MSSTTAAGSTLRISSRALDAVGRADHLHRCVVEVGRHEVERRPVVVDEDDDRELAVRLRGDRLPSARATAGMAKPNVLPTPTVLSSHMRPPNSPTIRRDSVSPSPVPSSLAGPRPPCWKESKIRSWSSGGTPMPVSVTVTTSSVAVPVGARRTRCRRPG